MDSSRIDFLEPPSTLLCQGTDDVRAVIQRVTEASVTVDGQVVGQIQRGFLVLLGVAEEFRL